jgi:hypothetical protein
MHGRQKSPAPPLPIVRKADVPSLTGIRRLKLGDISRTDANTYATLARVCVA